jgi:hypothetical protein
MSFLVAGVWREFAFVERRGEIDRCSERFYPLEEGLDFDAGEEELVCFDSDANYIWPPKDVNKKNGHLALVETYFR